MRSQPTALMFRLGCLIFVPCASLILLASYGATASMIGTDDELGIFLVLSLLISIIYGLGLYLIYVYYQHSRGKWQAHRKTIWLIARVFHGILALIWLLTLIVSLAELGRFYTVLVIPVLLLAVLLLSYHALNFWFSLRPIS